MQAKGRTDLGAGGPRHGTRLCTPFRACVCRLACPSRSSRPKSGGSRMVGGDCSCSGAWRDELLVMAMG